MFSSEVEILFSKILSFSGLGCKFNNTYTLENGMINDQINDMLGNNLTSWNNNGTCYYLMIVIIEAPIIKLLHENKYVKPL